MSSFFVKVSTFLVERCDNEGKVESGSGRETKSTAAYAGFGSIKSQKVFIFFSDPSALNLLSTK